MAVVLSQQNDTLASVLDKHRDVLEERLVVNKIFLTCLVKLQLLPARDMLRLERFRTVKAKTAATLEAVVDTERYKDNFLSDARLRFIDALRLSGQMGLVSELTDYNREMNQIKAYQVQLEDQLEGIGNFLRQEQKEAKLPLEETFVVEKKKHKSRPKPQGAGEANIQQMDQEKPYATRGSQRQYGELDRSHTLPVAIDSNVGIVEHLHKWRKERTPQHQPRTTRVPHQKGVFITSLSNVYSSESDQYDAEVEEEKNKQKKSVNGGQGIQDKLTVYLQKAQYTTQDALQQLRKSKEIIEELHKKYNEAEHRNEDMQHKLVKYERRLHNIENSVMGKESSGRTLEVKNGKEDMSDSKQKKGEDSLCEQLLDDMMKEVKKRQSVLGKKVGPVPRENKAVRLRQGLQIQMTGQKKAGESSELRTKLGQLASLLNVYTQQEKQVTHKLSVVRRQRKGLRQNISEHIANEASEGTYKDEQRETFKSSEVPAVKASSDGADTEKSECYKMMCTIEKQVKEKKQRLRLSNPRLRPTAAGSSGTSEKDHSQSALTAKMSDLQSEIQQYIEIQHASSQLHKEDHQRQQREYEQKLKASEKQVTLLQKQLQDVSKQGHKPSSKGHAAKGHKKVSGKTEMTTNLTDDHRSSQLIERYPSQGTVQGTKYLDKFKQNKGQKKRALVRPMVRTLEVELSSEKSASK